MADSSGPARIRGGEMKGKGVCRILVVTAVGVLACRSVRGKFKLRYRVAYLCERAGGGRMTAGEKEWVHRIRRRAWVVS